MDAAPAPVSSNKLATGLTQTTVLQSHNSMSTINWQTLSSIASVP